MEEQRMDPFDLECEAEFGYAQHALIDGGFAFVLDEITESPEFQGLLVELMEGEERL